MRGSGSLKKALNIYQKVLIIVGIMLLVCTLWLFSNLYILNEVIWDENSPYQSYSVVVTRSGFLIDSNIKVYIKK